MTVIELIDHLNQFSHDTLVFLTEDQAADALSSVEHPDYITLDHLSYQPEDA